MKRIPLDVVGNIVIFKFPRGTLRIFKKLYAINFLRKNKKITTALEKVGGFSGRLRKLKTKHLAGIKTKEAVYKENDCIFEFNIDDVYFSPRLSNERKIISDEILKLCKKSKLKILVMFAGISVYPIIIAKKLKRAKKSAVVFSNELNKKANIFAKKNILLNKVGDFVELIPGDAKRIPDKLNEKFDIIVMPRPNLKETFLKTALKLSKKGTVIFYHGFGKKEKVLEEIKREIGDKIGKIEIRKAGDIGPYEFRWLAKFKIKKL